jgi:predicted NBD/HSP70 family sugar kinase
MDPLPTDEKRISEMLNNTDLQGLHAGLARRVWMVSPSVRLSYHTEDDALVAEFVQAAATFEIRVHNHLLVEFDGTDPDAMPTTLYLTGVQTATEAPEVEAARTVLGEALWAESVALIASGSEQIDLMLEAEAAVDLRNSWRGLEARLRGPAMIGMEFIPGLVQAVLTDGQANVLDTATVDIDGNSPDSVVSAVAAAVDELSERHPDSRAASCPAAIQLGGPVNSSTGEVLLYDKPWRPDDPAWKDVPLANLIEERTHRPALVYNDAQALAKYEARFGLGRELDTVAVLVVRRGIGAKLVLHGEVADFPMEIGIYASSRATDRHRTATRRRPTIEDRSGTAAITKRVTSVTGTQCRSVEEAAAIADHDDKAVDAFWRAGADLAVGLAAIQAIIDPEAWAIYGPDALVDNGTRSGRAFLAGLATMSHHLDWEGLRPGLFQPRSTTGSLGARAAAVAALGVSR